MGFIKDITGAIGSGVETGSGLLGDAADLGKDTAFFVGDVARSDEAANISSSIGDIFKANTPSGLISNLGQQLGISNLTGGLGSGLKGLGGGLGGLFKNPMTIILIVVALVVVLMVIK